MGEVGMMKGHVIVTSFVCAFLFLSACTSRDTTSADVSDTAIGGPSVSLDLTVENGAEQVLAGRSTMTRAPSGPDNFFEDFEGCPYGHYVNGSGKWTYHAIYDFGRTTVSANPFSFISPKCAMGVNTGSGPMDQSVLLSRAFDIERGTLEVWMASDRIDAEDRTATTLVLYGTDSESPSHTQDRMLEIGFNYGTLSYHGTGWGDIIPSAAVDTWYHLEIDFDCVAQGCEITVTDTIGDVLGVATGVDLLNFHGSVRRIGLVTGPKVNYEATTSYWDDLLIEAADYRVTESDDHGGSWFDALKDLSHVSRSSNITQIPTGGVLSGMKSAPLEDFESYSDGEGIVGKNGWRFHTSFNKGIVVADRSRPHSALTPTTLYQHCNEESYSSEILSKELFLVRGAIDFWMASNYREPTDHTTTQFFLWGDYKDNPTLSERMLAIVYAYDEIRVSNGVYQTLIDTISTDTWYHIRVDVDLPLKKVSVYGMDRDGAVLGSVTNISLEHDYPMVKMVALIAGKMTGGTYITSYWDDITISETDLFGTGYVESVPIDLPPDCVWTTMKVSKREQGGSELSIRLLDASTSDDTGMAFDNRSSTIDLSGLGSLGTRSLVLNATLRPGPKDPSVLLGWGVEWENTSGFRDSFLTPLRLSRSVRTDQIDGGIGLSMGMFTGEVRSIPIPIPDKGRVPTVHLDTPIDIGPSLDINLLDSSSGGPVGKGFEIGERTYAFCGEGLREVDSVCISATFNTALRRPVLRSWSFYGPLDRSPEVTGLSCPPFINRTDSAMISVYAIDPDQPDGSLSVGLSGLEVGGTVWETSDIELNGYNGASGAWEFLFSPSNTSLLGPFSFKVKVTDEHGRSTDRIFDDAIEVRNIRPTTPVIALSPSDPKTDTDIVATLVRQSDDGEGGPVLYCFKWYVNGDEETDFSEENVPGPMGSVLPHHRFVKNDIIRCESYAFDGSDRSDTSFSEIRINNSPPRRVPPYTDTYAINEDEEDPDGFDLNELVLDADSDKVNFFIEGQSMIDLNVDSDGVLWIETQPNWFGKERVTVSAEDQESRVVFEMTLSVDPMNDAPIVESVGASGSVHVPRTAPVPASMDDQGRPGDLTDGEMVDIKGYEEELLMIDVLATDVETGELRYYMETFSDTPFRIVQDRRDGSVFTLIPEKDAFGEWWLRLWADDGGERGNVSVWIHLNLSNVNDPPVGFIVLPTGGYVEGRTRANLTFSARVLDVDPDVLTVRWYTEEEVLATGAKVNISWVLPGIYIVRCSLTDGYETVDLGSITVNITSPPAGRSGDGGARYSIAPVIVALLVLTVLLGVAGMVIIRARSKKRYGARGEAEGMKAHSSMLLPPSSGADDRMLALGMSSLVPAGALPPPTPSILRPFEDDGQGTVASPVIKGELPPAKAEAQPSTVDEYIRPQSSVQRGAIEPGMMAVPILGAQPNAGPLPPQIEVETVTVAQPTQVGVEDELMKLVASGTEPPERELFHEEKEHVWTPGMVESRVASEAKSAVELLRELSELRDSGAISDEEYEVSKRRLLRKI